jgi:probable F420-dependent oxidoreductase
MLDRRFRFGVQYTGSTLPDWQDFARKAEELGFTTLAVQDHLGQQLSPLHALVAAAAVTTRLRMATVVLDNDFRHPALLAKEAATVDVLTDGRLELGIGAGWMTSDYEKAGISFDAPGERLGRLRESVSIIKGFFSEEKAFSFHGKHYHIEGIDTSPRAVQQPRPPIMIGGRQKRMLSLAAREADIVSISMLDRTVPGEPPPPTFAEKVAWVKEAAGERFDRLVIHANASNLEVTDNAEEALERLSNRTGRTREELLEGPATLVGSVGSIVEQLQMWRERCGVSYFVVQQRLMDDVAPVVARLTGT